MSSAGDLKRPGGFDDGESRAMPANLEDLRRQIDAIDEQIVHLLSERRACVQNVVALKTAHNLPVYHPAREEDLISQRRNQALKSGLDPDHVEGLFRTILRQSRMRQTVHVAKAGVKPGYRVLIVGGRGRMGRYFGRWFSESGYEVRVLDIEDWPRAAELCSGIHLALISVPIDVTLRVIEDLGPFLPPECVLADITSVKHPALGAMLRSHQGPVVGLHPLFGPSTSSMDKQLMVSVSGRDPESCRWLLDQMTTWGNIVLPIGAAEHDEIMDLVQGVRHFATFAFGHYLSTRNVDLTRTLEISSPIYRLELGMVGRLFAQDASLYASIIFASPQRRAMVKDFARFMADTVEWMDESGQEKFCREFARIAEWFGPFCEQAMRESSFVIDKLVERF